MERITCLILTTFRARSRLSTRQCGQSNTPFSGRQTMKSACGKMSGLMGGTPSSISTGADAVYMIPATALKVQPVYGTAFTPPPVLICSYLLSERSKQTGAGKRGNTGGHSMAVDSDLDVDAAVMEIATTWGIRTDRVEPVVDQYGIHLTLQAKAQVESEMRNGFAVQSPFGYMVSLLRKGVIQAQAVQDDADGAAPDWHGRYHRGRWLSQLVGNHGPGSCFCCVDGGPYAGKAAPDG